jgi:hypothetical protein
MSKLVIGFWKRITEIVNTEKRYFDYLDFVPNFIVDGQVHSISYGTFRNYASKLVRAEKIEVVEYSPQAFYTLKGIRIENVMTTDHTGALLHDIHLRFQVDGIWSSIPPQYKSNRESNDKQLLPFPWKIKDLDIKATVHPTDTVSVIVGCSYCPIAVDANGVMRLSNALATVQERISNIANEDGLALSIPDHMRWTVTMWHFGTDALTTYTREKFYASWEVAQHALIIAYSKDWKDGKSRVRIEKQEYPQKSLAEALEEKLNAIR